MMASKKQCERALDLYAERLSRLKNVVGLGIVPEAGEGPASERCALAIYVTKKLPLCDLAPSDVLPESVEVPGRGKARQRIKTHVIEQGVVELESESGPEPLPE